jgi:hypothetical protein
MFLWRMRVCWCVLLLSVLVCVWDELVVESISPYSSVVEHSLRKRKVGGSIPLGGTSFSFGDFHLS